MSERASDQLRLRAKAVFVEAIEAPVAERAALLARACGGDGSLMTEVKALLSAFERSATARGTADEEDHLAPSLVGKTIGRYRLLELIGEGGFGEVYLAEQSEPVRRQVALKIIKPGMDSRAIIARFEQERQALAMMDHPHIARVLDAGQTEVGRPYFVMELVRGVPITEYCDSQALGATGRLGLFLAVCQAVQHAHQKGVIHRDIKPSNVLVTIADGRPVPKVIDFGIAKATGARLTDKTVFTDFRVLLGTPEYMSPEQADPHGPSGRDIDTRSDIYSLGVLLYEMLTGTTPFERARLRTLSIGEIQRVIREEDPPKPSTRLSLVRRTHTTPARAEGGGGAAIRRGLPGQEIARSIRGDLDWIVMKAMEKDRVQRYDTAAAMALDIERHLRDEAVSAGPPSTTYRLRKLLRRHRVAFAAGGVVIAALLGGLLLSVYGLVRAGTERDEKEVARAGEAKQREEAVKSAAAAERRAYRASIAAAQAALQLGDAQTARRHLDAAPEMHRRWEWTYLRHLMDRSHRQVDLGAEGLKSSKLNGAYLLVSSASGTYELRNWVKGSRVVLDGAELDPMAVSVNARGDRVLVCGYRIAALFDARTGEKIKEYPDGPRFEFDAFSADGRYFAVMAAPSKRVQVMDAVTGEVVRELPLEGTRRSFPTFSPDGRFMAVERDNVDTALLRAPDWEEVRRMPGAFPRFTPDGTGVMTIEDASRSPRLGLWDVGTGALLSALSLVETNVFESGGWGQAYAVSPDGQYLALLGRQGGIGIHDARTLSRLHLLCGTSSLGGGLAGGVAFSPDSSQLAAIGHDRVLRVWDVNLGAEPFQVRMMSDMTAVTTAISPDARLVVTGDWGRLMVFDALTGAPLWSIFHSLEFIEALAFSPDGLRIAVAGDRGTVCIVSAGDGSLLASAVPRGFGRFGGHALPSIAWTTDGATVVMGTSDGEIVGLESHKLMEKFSRPIGSGAVTRLVGSVNGQFAAVCDGGVFVLSGANLDGVIRAPLEGIGAAAWSSKGDRLAAAGAGIGAVLDREGKVVQCLTDVSGQVVSVAFSNDCSRLVGATDAGGFGLWDTDSGEQVVMLPSVSAGLTRSMTFSPDGSALLTSGPSEVIGRYDSAPLDSAMLASRETSRRAREIVDHIRAEVNFAAPTAERLTVEPGVTESIRAEALRLNAAVGNHAAAINNGAFLMCAFPGDQRVAERAMANSELAVARCPDPYVLNVNGIALYRGGRFEEAIAMLDRAEEGYRQTRPAYGDGVVQIEAFRCMSLLRLGQRDLAATSRAKLDRLMAGASADEYSTSWLAEIRQIEAGKPAQ